MFCFTKVCSHAFQKAVNQLHFYFVLMHYRLETIEYRVHADATLNGFISFVLKLIQQFFFVVLMKRVNYLVGKTYKAVNSIYRLVKFLVEAVDAKGKTGTISTCSNFTGLKGHFVKKRFHNKNIF